MMTIADPDLEAMLRVIEQETGDPPATVLRRALARALAVRDDDPVPPRTASDAESSTRGGTPSDIPSCASRPPGDVLGAETRISDAITVAAH